MHFTNNRPYLYQKIFESIGELKLYKKMKQKGFMIAIEKSQYPNIEVIMDESLNNYESKDQLKNFLLKKLNENRHKSKNFTSAISLNTFFTTFVSLYHCLPNITDLKTEWLQNLTNKIDKIFNEDVAEIVYLFSLVSDEAAIQFTDIRKQLIYFNFDLETDIDGKPLRKVVLKATPCQKDYFFVENANRVAFRVGYSDGLSGLVYPCINQNNTEFPVYIQSHAIDALKNRIDCLELPLVMDFINRAIIDNGLIDFNGITLLSYSFFGIKLGYFVVSFIENRILLRTFLFITNDGTPEGEKINQAYHIDKHEKRYLDIDKLSSFMLSDIECDDRLKYAFSQFGIGHLFNIVKKGALPVRLKKAQDLKRILCIDNIEI